MEIPGRRLLLATLLLVLKPGRGTERAVRLLSWPPPPTLPSTKMKRRSSGERWLAVKLWISQSA
jgi:hypothetical protein